MQSTLKIVGISGYLPEQAVPSETLDERFGWPQGTAFKRSGVKVRHFVGENETAIDMAECAYNGLVANALHEGVVLPEPEVLIGASGTALQAIPFNATFFKQRLFPHGSGFPAFDINSTCLSFVWGLQVAHALPYSSSLLVSSDVASCGLNWDRWESSLIFGDGAAVCQVEKMEKIAHGNIHPTFHFITLPKGREYCQIRAGGSLRHPLKSELETSDFLFAMDGKRLFKLVSKHLDEFVATLLNKAGLKMSDIDLVIPHQASALAMQHAKKQLGLSSDQYVDIFATHGNQIATSIPMAMFRAVESGRLRRGHKMMLIGTSAGISIGGAILEY